jgi:hypothetical protein
MAQQMSGESQIPPLESFFRLSGSFPIADHQRLSSIVFSALLQDDNIRLLMPQLTDAFPSQPPALRVQYGKTPRYWPSWFRQ